ncbi:MAG: AMP-binding protein, partial [Candidatus Hodarchaeota archaeon]
MEPEDWIWIGDWTGRRAQLTPSIEAIYDHIHQQRYSYSQMDERATRLARVLLNLGIEKGDRIGAYSKNRIELVDLFFASGKIGGIFVPFNIRLAA